MKAVGSRPSCFLPPCFLPSFRGIPHKRRSTYKGKRANIIGIDKIQGMQKDDNHELKSQTCQNISVFNRLRPTTRNTSKETQHSNRDSDNASKEQYLARHEPALLVEQLLDHPAQDHIGRGFVALLLPHQHEAQSHGLHKTTELEQAPQKREFLHPQTLTETRPETINRTAVGQVMEQTQKQN